MFSLQKNIFITPAKISILDMVRLKIDMLSKAHDVLCRALRVDYARGSLETPTRVLNVHQEGKILIRRDINRVAEIYLQFSFERLEAMFNDFKKQEMFARRLRMLVSRHSRQNMVVVIPSIEDRPSRAPSMSPKDVGCYIADLVCFPDVDLVTTPIFYRVNEELIPQIVDGFLEATGVFKNKIAFALPEASMECKRTMLNLYQGYLDKNDNLLINFICMDYNGSNPISKHVDHNLLLRLVKAMEIEYGSEVVIYGINVKYSKIGRKYEKITARDLLAPYLGVDIIGPNHRRPIIAKEVAETLHKVHFYEKKVLDTNRYLYVNLRVQVEEQRNPRLDKLFMISRKSISKKEFEALLNAYNAVEYLAELHNVKKLIKEKGSLYDYVTRKEGLLQDGIARKRMDVIIKSMIRRERQIDEYLK